jgi:protein ImuA
MSTKAEILARLQQDILALQGFRPATVHAEDDTGLGVINRSFPAQTFPLSAVHEFICTTAEEATASGAFIAGLLSSLMRKGAPALWVSSSRLIFPPALKFFGLHPEKVIFLDLKKEKEVAWAMEEALKCSALAAVVGEMPELSFTASRRFQLAVERSGVSCLLLRRNPKNMATAAVTRWKIKPLPSRADGELPGIGFPRWRVELVKVRNGKPGAWDMEWAEEKFRHVSRLAVLSGGQQKKTG